MEKIFEDIITHKRWSVHPCGSGSTLEYTEPIRKELPKLIEQYNKRCFNKFK